MKYRNEKYNVQKHLTLYDYPYLMMISSILFSDFLPHFCISLFHLHQSRFHRFENYSRRNTRHNITERSLLEGNLHKRPNETLGFKDKSNGEGLFIN